MKTGRRLLAAAALGLLLPSMTVGCYGRFDLTRKVYRFNGDISSDKWIVWLAFLVMTIIPVYGFATFLDAILFNSVEFWTGDRLLAQAGPHVVVGPNGEVASSTLLDDGSIQLELVDPEGKLTELRVVREHQTVAAYDADGNLVARVGDLAGEPALLSGPR